MEGIGKWASETLQNLFHNELDEWGRTSYWVESLCNKWLECVISEYVEQVQTHTFLSL